MKVLEGDDSEGIRGPLTPEEQSTLEKRLSTALIQIEPPDLFTLKLGQQLVEVAQHQQESRHKRYRALQFLAGIGGVLSVMAGLFFWWQHSHKRHPAPTQSNPVPAQSMMG